MLRLTKIGQNSPQNFYPICLAPMVGLSHAPMRLLLREYLPAGWDTIWPTEMLNSRKLPKEDFSKTPEVMRGETETNLVPQILGNEEIPIRESILKLQDWGAVGIDINMGCPVQKALKHNYGVALMGDSDYAAKVVEMAVRSSELPVSVKLRAGETNDFEKLLGFVSRLKNSGASWVTLHPRTIAQKRRGTADWAQIKNLKTNLDIPVIGNGDIQTVDDVFEMQNQTGCDGVMVGRALTARPWLFWQYGQRLGLSAPIGKSALCPHTPEEEGAEYGRSLLKLLDLMDFFYAPISENLVLRKFRFYVKTGSVWLEFGHELYSVISRVNTIKDVRQAIEIFFNQEQRMTQRTELRQ